MKLKIRATINLPNDELDEEYEVDTGEAQSVAYIVRAIKTVHPSCDSVVLTISFADKRKSP